MRPVLIISVLISLLIVGWLGAMQLGVMSNGMRAGAVQSQSAPAPESQPEGSVAPAGPVNRALELASQADERQRQMEGMMNQ